MGNIKICNDKREVNVIEKIFLIGIGVLCLILFELSLIDSAFVSSFFIMMSLELFSFGYLFRNKNNMHKYIYGIFIMGIVFMLFGIIYTVVRIYNGV